MDTLLLAKFVASLILPPGGLIVLLALGLALRPWRPRLGMSCMVAALLALYLLSASPVAKMLVLPLEETSPLTPQALDGFDAEAIVVLGGGRRQYAPEYGGETVSPATLERIRFGARIHRETGLPLAVTGGVVHGERQPEAELMARALRQDLGVEPRWVETESRNTEQNASLIRRLLERDGVTRIVLVTHAVHLDRAAAMFRASGFTVLEAPTAFIADPRQGTTWRDWIPSGAALGASSLALHEHLGKLWFRLRQRLGYASTGAGG